MKPVFFFSLLLAFLVSGCQLIPAASGPAPTGKIVWPKDGDVWVYTFANKAEKRTVPVPQGNAATGSVWSPDGSKILLAQFGRRAGERVTGSDLMLASADGSNVETWLARDQPGNILENPYWAASGQVYYGLRQLQGNIDRVSILRRSATGETVTLVEDGTYPAPSPDESMLVYLRGTRVGVSLHRKNLNTGEDCELMPDSVFFAIDSPRVSPDGKTIAFSASGPATPVAGNCPTTTAQHLLETAGSGALATLGFVGELSGIVPRVAYAHGPPWDLWTMNMDGTGMKRLAEIGDDNPSVAWSPDGKHLAFFAPQALFLVDAASGKVSKLIEGGGYGGMDWAP